MKKLIAPNFYDRVGKHIIEWLKENKKSRRKPTTQKELAARLKIEPPQLSRYIAGVNEMPAICVTILIDHLGFQGKYFTDYFAEKQNGIIPEQLSKEDLFKLIFHQQQMIKEWKEFGVYHSDRSRKLLDDNRDMVLTCKRYLDEIEKLRNEVKKLKSNS